MKESISIKSRIDDIELDIFTPDDWDEKKLVIFCHGFNSGKGSDTYTTIGDKMLEKGIAYAKFTLPYHAERRHDYKDFTVENCIEDCELVDKYLRERFYNTQIGILGTSFGGYITLLRQKRFNHDYFVIILKSPAIKMDKIFRSFMSDEEFEYYKKLGFGINNHKEDEMKISFGFYEELVKNQVMDADDYSGDIQLYHGTIDDTAPYEDSVEFANKYKNVVLHSLEGENHKISSNALNKFCEDVANYCASK